jgi:hypothetical protein
VTCPLCNGTGIARSYVPNPHSRKAGGEMMWVERPCYHPAGTIGGGGRDHGPRVPSDPAKAFATLAALATFFWLAFESYRSHGGNGFEWLIAPTIAGAAVAWVLAKFHTLNKILRYATVVTIGLGVLYMFGAFQK